MNVDGCSHGSIDMIRLSLEKECGVWRTILNVAMLIFCSLVPSTMELQELPLGACTMKVSAIIKHHMSILLYHS